MSKKKNGQNLNVSVNRVSFRGRGILWWYIQELCLLYILWFFKSGCASLMTPPKKYVTLINTAGMLKKDVNLCFCSAAQMWLLGRILPIIIGDLVPEGDPYWENYLLIMKIVDILFSTNLHEDLFGYLSHLIFCHHSRFTELYPNESVIPKMHFMVHMPRLTLQ